jgi:hypothetical protein
MSKQPDTDDDDPNDALEQALIAIHGIADVLNAVGQCRDIVMPTNGLSYLGSELQRAYEEAQEAFERIGWAKQEPQPRAAEAMAAPPPDAGTRRALRKLVDKWDAEAGGDGDSAA